MTKIKVTDIVWGRDWDGSVGTPPTETEMVVEIADIRENDTSEGVMEDVAQAVADVSGWETEGFSYEIVAG